VIVSILLLTPVHGEVILKRNENSKIVFAHMSSRKVERFIQATLYRHSVLTTLLCMSLCCFVRQILPIFRAEIQFFDTQPNFSWNFCERSPWSRLGLCYPDEDPMIIFKKFITIWSWYTNVTDRQADERTEGRLAIA